MQTTIGQKRPNFRISYFRPSKCHPCTVPSHALLRRPLRAATGCSSPYISVETGNVTWSMAYFSNNSIKPDSLCLHCLPRCNILSEDQWFLKRSYCYRFIDNKIYEVEQLLDSVTHDLFTKIKSPGRCLYPLLPRRKDRYITVRRRGHEYELPSCTYNLHKQSYIVNCLFKFLWYVLMHCMADLVS